MPTLEALHEIYENYEQNDPGSDACNQAFLDAVEEWTAAFAASQPDPAEALLRGSRDHGKRRKAYGSGKHKTGDFGSIAGAVLRAGV